MDITTKINIRDIFLSHRSIDKVFVRRLAADIECTQYENRNLLTWIDEAEIQSGSIPGHINWGLENSRCVAFVMTPDYFNSPSGWTDAEWHAALHLDPDNRNGRLLPVLAKDCPYIPILLRHLKIFDLRGNRYKQGLRELLAVLRNEQLRSPSIYRGQLISTSGRIDRQTYIAERSVIEGDPDITNEYLHCNLLPIIRLPQYIYTAPVSVNYCTIKNDGNLSLPSKQQLKNIIKEHQKQISIEKPYVPVFRIFKGRIVTFHDLDSSSGPFAFVINDSDIQVTESSSWIQDEDHRKILISLLNMTISRHAIHRGLIADDSKNYRFYFPPGENGEANVFEWIPAKLRKVHRTVAKPCTTIDGKVLFWRHQAAYLKIQFLANKFYLQVIPTVVLTDDGRTVKGGSKVTTIVNKWLGRERNLHILYHIRFWSVILQGRVDRISMKAGDQRLEIETLPANVNMGFGIIDDQMKLMDRLNEEAELIDDEIECAIDLAIEDGINKDEEDLFNEDDIIELGEESDEGNEVQ